MKKAICMLMSLVLLISMCFSFASCSKSRFDSDDKTIEAIDTNGIDVDFIAKGNYFYTNQSKKWERQFLSGVNIGLTLATTDLNNPNIDYKNYMQWFSDISAMNVNTIKVFSIMNPDFYKALYDYNNSNENKLYFFQGIWFNENYLYDIADAFDSDKIIENAFKKSIKETIDVVHGKSNYTNYGDIVNAEYKWNVSNYLCGYILGLEWPSDFVINTNEHNDKEGYNGKYLCATSSANAFETFLAMMGDYLISTQTQKYSYQTPVAFLNWSTTDTIKHSNEPFEEEDAVSVNTENIISTDKYYAGLFAAIDIYPYYPEFLNHQKEYLDYKDKNGKSNPYEAYLKDLKNQYSVPIIVAEFGLPTSRGVAHNSVMGYNQGGITEKQQGQYITEMFDSIIDSKFAGGMIFSWQDEWFKQTWNTIKYYPDDASQRTKNVQSAEQNYGILAVDAGENDACIIDGQMNEWNENDLVCSTDYGELYSKYDESYIYFAVKPNGSNNVENDAFYIPISTVGIGSNFSAEYGLSFDKNVDFIICVDNKNSNIRVLTDAYYDSFAYVQGYQRGAIKFNQNNMTQNSGVYNKINMFTSNEMYLPDDDKTLPPTYYESGKLQEGTTNQSSEEYNSLADFCYGDNAFEARIPWYLLNVQNSTNGTAINDFYKDGDLATCQFDSVYVALATANSSALLKKTNYQPKEKSTYHTRLKSSYYIIQDYMKNIK